MSSITNKIGVDAVTITEALKRLAKHNLTPVRQSFYDALKTGKVREVTGKEDNPDGKRLISWASVLEYIENGGFKQRRKPADTTAGETETALTPTAPEVPNSPDEGAALECGNQEPANPLAPSVPPEEMGENRSSGNPVEKQSPIQNSKGKQKSASLPERTKPNSESKSQNDENAKGRRNPPLRVIKNGLRHLGFEDTKAIRDWADNRLLNVLHPARLQNDASSKDNAEHPA